MRNEYLGRNEEQVFGFDYVYSDCVDPSHIPPAITALEQQILPSSSSHTAPISTQLSIFQELGSILLANTLAGFNVSLLAYGQTGAGKSYT
jgi:hypothetical protein